MLKVAWWVWCWWRLLLSVGHVISQNLLPLLTNSQILKTPRFPSSSSQSPTVLPARYNQVSWSRTSKHTLRSWKDNLKLRLIMDNICAVQNLLVLISCWVSLWLLGRADRAWRRRHILSFGLMLKGWKQSQVILMLWRRSRRLMGSLRLLFKPWVFQTGTLWDDARRIFYNLQWKTLRYPCWISNFALTGIYDINHSV